MCNWGPSSFIMEPSVQLLRSGSFRADCSLSFCLCPWSVHLDTLVMPFLGKPEHQKRQMAAWNALARGENPCYGTTSSCAVLKAVSSFIRKMVGRIKRALCGVPSRDWPYRSTSCCLCLYRREYGFPHSHFIAEEIYPEPCSLGTS